MIELLTPTELSEVAKAWAGSHQAPAGHGRGRSCGPPNVSALQLPAGDGQLYLDGGPRPSLDLQLLGLRPRASTAAYPSTPPVS